jgi:transposase
MNTTTVAVDLAKSVFQLAVADEHWRVVETQRLNRTQFERWFLNREVNLVIMEACGSSHHRARRLNGLGVEVRLLPAQYVRAYVKRNKTDAIGQPCWKLREPLMDTRSHLVSKPCGLARRSTGRVL